MKELYDFIARYSERGDCTCGRCADASSDPKQPAGHTADMIFFKVAARNKPDRDRLKALIQANVSGEFASCDLFDGKEHSYIELGAWIGDQGTALELMGLGTILGLWRLFSPVTVLHLPPGDPVTQQMVGMGFLSIIGS